MRPISPLILYFFMTMFRVFAHNKSNEAWKHVHISGRWPTSRQYRFERYVLGTMLKVVASQRIKRARSAREDSSIYIYIIYIYIHKRGPISRVQGSQPAIPPGSDWRKKSLFLASQKHANRAVHPFSIEGVLLMV